MARDLPGRDQVRFRARTTAHGRFPGRAARPPRRSLASRLLIAAVIMGLVAGGAYYLRLEKRVNLVVDGRATELRTFDSTVGDLLDAVDVSVGHHDRVEPDPDADLADGMRVEVILAKQVTLVLDGSRRTVWVTDSETVEDVLEEANISAGPQAYVRPRPKAPVEDGDVIVFRRAKAVDVTVGGETETVITNAPDVGYLLDSMGVIVRARDRVTPGRRAKVRPGMEIQVIRIRVTEAVEEEAIPFETETRYSDEMYEDEERVEREGVEGTTRKVFQVRTRDGVEVHRELVESEVVKEPVDRVVVRGTRPRNVEEGQASWYERDGMVAAHPSLPFGTSVHVTNVANGRTVTVVINDRGPYVEGRIIDLSDDAFAQLAPLSSGTCSVRITW